MDIPFGVQSPIGSWKIASNGTFITEIFYLGNALVDSRSDVPACMLLAKKQLEEYFRGERSAFSFPILLNGTDFQKWVWQALLKIPYGQTRSYGQIAESIGKKGASRAVGMANHRNPVAIAIPCHRVIGADGSLTGYGGGLAVKSYLLSLESTHWPDENSESNS